jgi:hypothetical protein
MLVAWTTDKNGDFRQVTAIPDARLVDNHWEEVDRGSKVATRSAHGIPPAHFA